MEAMLRRWEESGLSLRAFGTKEGVPYSRLMYWRRKLRPGPKKEKSAQRKAKADLVPVKVVPDERPSDERPVQLTAWLPNGVSIDVRAGFDQLELRRLVDVVSSC
jgi:hypothetical protein